MCYNVVVVALGTYPVVIKNEYLSIINPGLRSASNIKSANEVKFLQLFWSYKPAIADVMQWALITVVLHSIL